jgi:hypothetical protein
MHQPDQAGLRCSVVWTDEMSDIRRRGRDQYLPAQLAAPHRGQARRLDPERLARVCADRFVEQSESDFFDPSSEREAGIVDPDSDITEPTCDQGDHRLDLVRHRDVTPDRDRTMPAFRDRFDDFIGGRSVFLVIQGDISAGADKRDRASKPATLASHQSDFSLEIHRALQSCSLFNLVYKLHET